jgi:hypothetical protein
MYVSKRIAVALLAAAAFAGSAMVGASALASNGDHGDQRGGERSVLDTSLAPSVPADPRLFGVAAGGLPWVLQFGRADLRRDGRLDVVIRGLVIPIAPVTGTPGLVTGVSAGLYCDDSSTAAATSATVPLSRDGDARIRATLPLPSKCLAPALLIHPNGASSLYIAASGFGG